MGREGGDFAESSAFMHTVSNDDHSHVAELLQPHLHLPDRPPRRIQRRCLPKAHQVLRLKGIALRSAQHLPQQVKGEYSQMNECSSSSIISASGEVRLAAAVVLDFRLWLRLSSARWALASPRLLELRVTGGSGQSKYLSGEYYGTQPTHARVCRTFRVRLVQDR